MINHRHLLVLKRMTPSATSIDQATCTEGMADS